MKKALIVYGGWEGHNPKETSAIAATDLRAEGFDVQLTDTLDVLVDSSALKQFDLIVPNWTMGQLSGEQEKGIVAAIESGVGLGGFHGGMGDAFRGNTGYQFMVGGQFVAHPDNHRAYTVKIVKSNDPIVQGLADFTITTEQYYMHVDPSIDVLATTEFQTISAPWVNGTVMPVVWKRRHGQGKVFYQSIGHNEKEFAVPEVREITRRGLVWAAR
jgi:type 1 glutamine amidotransferase